MDEERENQEQEQQQQKPNMMEQAARRGLNMAEQQAKNVAKEGAKEGAKKVGAAIGKFVVTHIVPIAIILAIIIVICLIIFVLIPAVEDYLDGDTATSVDEITYQTVEEYCTIDETGVHMDKEGFLKNIVVYLAEGGIDLNDLGFGNDGNYVVKKYENGKEIQSFDPNSEAAGYLYKYVTAALAGELPYIPGSDEETQGIIRIKRRKNANEEAKDLTYIGYQKFQEMLQSTNENVKKDIMNYFTLDESWNLCIAKSYKKTINKYSHDELIDSQVEYTISEIKIPYRTMVTQYTVPFLFLIDLQLITQNANYVEAVSELMTKQSEIEFTIFDSITIDTDEYEYDATRHSRKMQEVQTSGETVVGGRPTELVESEADVEDKTVVIEEIDNVIANVTKANTWIIEQETNYAMQETKEYP